MSIQRLGWIALAFLAGASGGIVTELVRVQRVSAAPTEPLRGSRFELVDQSGNTKAVIEGGTEAGATLTFFDAAKKNSLQLGMTPSGRPFVRLNGADGRARATLKLLDHDRPTLLMGDADWEQRLQLGATQPDAGPSLSDSWALLLGNPIDRSVFAAVGMNSALESGVTAGSLSIRASDGKRWDAPIGK